MQFSSKMYLDVVTFMYKLLNLNLQEAFHLWTCLHLSVKRSVFICGFLRLSWRGWIHKCIFFNKELSVANQMPPSFSANHMTSFPRGVPQQGHSTACSLRILRCFSVNGKKDCYPDLTFLYRYTWLIRVQPQHGVWEWQSRSKCKWTLLIKLVTLLSLVVKCSWTIN